MNWAKENKSLAGIVGFMIVGALGLGAWFYLTWSGYTESMDRWTNTDREIAMLKGGKLAPTDANVQSKEQVVGNYVEKVNLLRAALLSDKVQRAVTPISQTDFQARLKERANVVKGLSASAAMTRLADDFALGFDEYTNTVPRTAEVAAQLNVQLDVMEKLVTTLIQAGVTSIDMLERTKLADESAAPPPKAPPVAPTKAKSKVKTKAKGPKTFITEQAAAEPVLDRHPIKILLTTDQGPFQEIMNTLQHPGKMPHFLVVRQVHVENSRLDGPTKEEMAQRKNQTPAPAPGAEPPAPEASAAAATTEARPIAAPKPAPADASIIMGNESLKVYLEVDYIRFRPAPVEEGEAAAPAQP